MQKLTTITIAGVDFYAPSEVNDLIADMERKLYLAGLDDKELERLVRDFLGKRCEGVNTQNKGGYGRPTGQHIGSDQEPSQRAIRLAHY